MKKIKNAKLESENEQLLLNAPHMCGKLIVQSLRVKFEVKMYLIFTQIPLGEYFQPKGGFQVFEW